MGVELLSYLKTLLVFLLLFVNYAQTEIDLVGLFKVGLHPHDLRKCFFGMLQRTITVIKNSNAIPKFRLLTWNVSFGCHVGVCGIVPLGL